MQMHIHLRKRNVEPLFDEGIVVTLFVHLKKHGQKSGAFTHALITKSTELSPNSFNKLYIPIFNNWILRSNFLPLAELKKY